MIGMSRMCCISKYVTSYSFYECCIAVPVRRNSSFGSRQRFGALLHRTYPDRVFETGVIEALSKLLRWGCMPALWRKRYVHTSTTLLPAKMRMQNRMMTKCISPAIRESFITESALYEGSLFSPVPSSTRVLIDPHISAHTYVTILKYICELFENGNFEN